MSPMSDVGLSLLQHRVLEILRDARDVELRLARELAVADKPPIGPLFYTREQVDALRAEHAEALAALTPKEESAWVLDKARQASAKARASSASGRPDSDVVLDMVEAAVKDSRVSTLSHGVGRERLAALDADRGKHS